MKERQKLQGKKVKKDEKQSLEEKIMEEKLRQKHEALTNRLVKDKKKRAPTKSLFEARVLKNASKL